MKIFRTNKLAFEALRLSIELYRLDKSEQSRDILSMLVKTVLYDFMIDSSLVLVVLFSMLHSAVNDDRWLLWIFGSAGVYGLEVINKTVFQYFYYYSDSSCEERARGILIHAPKYIFFNNREKEMHFKILNRKIREVLW